MCIAAAVVGGAIVGGAMQANAAGKAAKAQQAGYDAASRESARQYDQTRADQMPWMTTGKNALNVLSQESGLGSIEQPLSYEDWAAQNSVPSPQWKGNWLAAAQGAVASAAPNKSGYDKYVSGFKANQKPYVSQFTASPGYQFRLQQGQDAQNNQFAARGGAFSGNALKALADYNQNMASNEYGNWWNRVAGLAGVGQAATNQVTAAGQQNSQNIQSNLIGGANARASGITGKTNAWTNALNSGVGLYGYSKGWW